jgi:hypothetical protein
VINQEDGPWYFLYGDSHWEYECNRHHNNNGSDENPNNYEHVNYINTLDLVYTISSQEYYNFLGNNLRKVNERLLGRLG